jgi:hypothetical protein
MSIGENERVVAIEPIGEGTATGLDEEVNGNSEAPPPPEGEVAATESDEASPLASEGGEAEGGDSGDDGGEES